MADIDKDVISALRLFAEDPQSRRVFDAIMRQGGKASGWEITKLLGQDPDALKGSLAKLREHNILNATGAGLEGYYYLTPLGFQLRSSLAS